MSHFKVLVIGEDIHEQLAPFNEQPYYDDEACKPYMIWTLYGKKNEYHGDTREEAEKACEDAGDIIDDGPYCSNSQAKWNWYQLGSRWSGLLKYKADSTSHKNGDSSVFFGGHPADGYCDSVLKKDLDLEGMFAEKEKQANKWWNEAMNIFGELPEHKTMKQILEEFEIKFGKIDKDLLNKAKEEYSIQPRVIAANIAAKEKEDSCFHYTTGFKADDFATSKKAFIENIKITGLSPYAIVKNKQWIPKGNTEWFGISQDHVIQDHWNNLVVKFIEELPDDARLNMVDCRI